MKRIISINALLCAVLIACNKKGPEIIDPPVNTALSVEDSTASLKMSAEITLMNTALDSLKASVHHNHQLHWDSLYHHHDSLFWHHHYGYHHGTYAHDDHQHTWTHYDSTINHNHHHHHVYPGHPHDSLITTHNNSNHNNNDKHHHGHDWNHHHVLDSLHHIHNLHHS